MSRLVTLSSSPQQSSPEGPSSTTTTTRCSRGCSWLGTRSRCVIRNSHSRECVQVTMPSPPLISLVLFSSRHYCAFPHHCPPADECPPLVHSSPLYFPLSYLSAQILDTQYRMHPNISKFPSKHFYGGLLLDGEVWTGMRGQIRSPYPRHSPTHSIPSVVHPSHSTQPRSLSWLIPPSPGTHSPASAPLPSTTWQDASPRPLAALQCRTRPRHTWFCASTGSLCTGGGGEVRELGSAECGTSNLSTESCSKAFKG